MKIYPPKIIEFIALIGTSMLCNSLLAMAIIFSGVQFTLMGELILYLFVGGTVGFFWKRIWKWMNPHQG